MSFKLMYVLFFQFCPWLPEPEAKCKIKMKTREYFLLAQHMLSVSEEFLFSGIKALRSYNFSLSEFC